MGKTPKPLVVLLTEVELASHPDIMALREKGHTFSMLEQECDVVLGMKAHWFHAKWSKMADVLEAAWARVYPKGGK